MSFANRWIQTCLAGGALLVGAGCGGPSREQRAMAEKDAQIGTLKEDNAQLQQNLASEQQLGKMAQTQNEALARQNGELAEKNGAVAVATKARVESLSVQIGDLEKKLAASKAGDVSVGQSANYKDGIVIRVAGTTLFDSGKAEVKSTAFETLTKVAQTLKAKYPGHFVRIEGHTDSTPIVRKEKFADNMELSTARAKAVFDYLVSKAGMPASKMYTAGFSDKQPIAWPEKTAADRAKNRRVDIVILPNIKVEKQSLASSR